MPASHCQDALRSCEPIFAVLPAHQSLWLRNNDQFKSVVVVANDVLAAPQHNPPPK